MSEKLEYADFLESGAYVKKLEETLVELEKLKKEKENIENVNCRLNYKLDILKETIKNMVDRI